MREPGFAAESAEAAGAFVKVRFRHAYKGVKNEAVEIAGSLVLDPERHWAVRSWAFSGRGTDFSHEAVFAEGDVDGYPVIKRLTDAIQGKNGRQETVMEFGSVRKADAAPSAFRLTA